MRKDNPFRVVMTVLVSVLLIYTGTIFLYRLCFIDFRIEPPTTDEGESVAQNESHLAWGVIDTFVTVIFWVDLFAVFFYSYDDADGNEVDDLRLIASKYLQSYFLVNVVACIPDELVALIITGGSTKADEASSNQGLRALRLQKMRLQRISRLARLMRLGRLGKIKALESSHLLRWFKRQKGVRVVNLSCGLMWIVHILACGWYLCAALHEVPADTWVMRRVLDAEGATVVDREPFDQWLNAMYFVLTVFTTVGFGDMFAVTNGEIVYVCITMGVGAVVHSIIISEVINVVTSSDQMNVFVMKQRELIEAFSTHTELDETSEQSMRRWVDTNAKTWFSTKYDRDGMMQLIMGENMPRELLDGLPSALFSGLLGQNRFLKICDGVCTMPPRLPMLLALAVHRSHFSEGEIIYQAQDYPFSMFLILKGTFAFVSKLPSSGSAQPGMTEQSTPPALAGMMVSAGDLLQNAGPNSSPEKAESAQVYPYMLFSTGSFFGESELVKETMPRRATARCESDAGDLLTLNKSDFKRLADQFPQFGAKWADTAMRREKRRTLNEAALSTARTYKHLAAKTVQDWFRESARRRRSAGRLQKGMTGKLLENPGSVPAASSPDNSPTSKAPQPQHREPVQDRLTKLSKEVRDVGRRLDDILDAVARFAPPMPTRM